MKQTSNFHGILCLCAGVAVFSVQDLILKLLSSSYPLHQAMVLRSLTALPFMMLIAWVFDGSLKTLASPTWPLMLARGVLNFLAYTAYYLALAALPIATTVALYFTAPLIITVLSVFLLKEKVSALRWMAVLGGFCGVIIMVRPGGALFDWAALLPVFCGFAYAGSMIMARSMGEKDSAAAMAFWGNNAFLVCALILSAVYGTGEAESTGHPSLSFLTRGWVTPTAQDLSLMCLCGVIAAVGLTLLTQAYRIGQSSIVAPFEYSFAFWGILWGWMFWRELPDFMGWIGIAIIIATGIVMLRAEGIRPAEKPDRADVF